MERAEDLLEGGLRMAGLSLALDKSSTGKIARVTNGLEDTVVVTVNDIEFDRFPMIFQYDGSEGFVFIVSTIVLPVETLWILRLLY